MEPTEHISNESDDGEIKAATPYNLNAYIYTCTGTYCSCTIGKGGGGVRAVQPPPPFADSNNSRTPLLEKFSGSGHAAGAFDTFEILLIFLSQWCIYLVNYMYTACIVLSKLIIIYMNLFIWFRLMLHSTSRLHRKTY